MGGRMWQAPSLTLKRGGKTRMIFVLMHSPMRVAMLQWATVGVKKTSILPSSSFTCRVRRRKEEERKVEAKQRKLAPLVFQRRNRWWDGGGVEAYRDVPVRHNTELLEGVRVLRVRDVANVFEDLDRVDGLPLSEGRSPAALALLRALGRAGFAARGGRAAAERRPTRHHLPLPHHGVHVVKRRRHLCLWSSVCSLSPLSFSRITMMCRKVQFLHVILCQSVTIVTCTDMEGESEGARWFE